jgi:hypothetical protein
MPFLTVLANNQGDVLGSAMMEVPARGSGFPGQVSVVARPGQQVILIEVDDDVLTLAPAELHEFIRVNYLLPTAEKRNQVRAIDTQHTELGSASENADLVRTPAGPMPRDSVHPVGLQEAVIRNPDGTYNVIPSRLRKNGFSAENCSAKMSLLLLWHAFSPPEPTFSATC